MNDRPQSQNSMPQSLSSPVGSADPSARRALFAALGAHPAGNPQAIDFAHAMLIAGLITAHKPVAVLELGVGSAFLTRVLLVALAENGRGNLTSVDNFFDWQSREPEHIATLRRESPNWRLVAADETSYLRNAAGGQFDFVMSDGDHTVAYQNAGDLFRVAQTGAVLALHDTNSATFGLLGRMPARCRKLGHSTLHFTTVSRPDERTDRGLLVIRKDHGRPFTMDLTTRLYLTWRERMPAALREWLRRRARPSSNPG